MRTATATSRQAVARASNEGGVEPAGVRHHPEWRVAERLGLLSGDCVDRDDARSDASDALLQREAALDQLGLAELVGTNCRQRDHVGDADAPPQQVGSILGPESCGRVDRVIHDPGLQQRWVEAIAWRREVRLTAAERLDRHQPGGKSLRGNIVTGHNPCRPGQQVRHHPASQASQARHVKDSQRSEET